MLIIADDITGAAEIAGIAFTQGHQVRLLCAGSSASAGSVCCDCVAAEEALVIATDTRSLSEAEATAETRRLVSSLSPLPAPLFKKTDSALRGHVVAELAALLEATGYRRAIYLPANPTKGRTIRNGVYYIKEMRDVPIHETAFSYDPEFPAKTSVLQERFPDAEAHGIIMPDAASMEDIRQVVAQYDDGKTLFAGAADLFSAVLAHSTLLTPPSSFHTPHSSFHTPPSSFHTPPSSFHTPHSTLLLCGSTQSKVLDLGIPVAPMPQALYDGADDLSLWDTTAYDEGHSLILSIPYTHRTGKDVAIHLRTLMAKKTRQLVEAYCPAHLIIEGGATAWATLQALGWNTFRIERQVAPGVVQMRADHGTLVTLKPGSYPWGALFGDKA